MTVFATSFLQDRNFIDVCYIVAFSLFIYGLIQLRGPRTAVRGNAIAAVGVYAANVRRYLERQQRARSAPVQHQGARP